MENKQTSIEWFYQRILSKDIKSVFEQAKEMHKQEIEDGFKQGFNRNYFSPNFQDQKEFAEQYYKETYKK